MCGLSSGPFRHFQHTSRRRYIYEMESISGRRRLLGVAGNWADDMTPRCKLRVERCQSLNLWLLLFEQDLRLHTPLNGAVRHCARDWNSAKSTSCWSSAVTGPPRNEPFPSPFSLLLRVRNIEAFFDLFRCSVEQYQSWSSI